MNIQEFSPATLYGSREFNIAQKEPVSQRLNLFRAAIVLLSINFILFAWFYLSPLASTPKTDATVATSGDKLSPFTEVVNEGPVKVKLPEKAVPVLAQAEPPESGSVDQSSFAGTQVVEPTPVTVNAVSQATIPNSRPERRYVQTVNRTAEPVGQVQSVDVPPASIIPNDYQIHRSQRQVVDPKAPAIGYAVGVETNSGN